MKPAPKVKKATLANRVRKASGGRPVLRVQRVIPVQPVPKARKGTRESRGHRASREKKEIPGNPARMDTVPRYLYLLFPAGTVSLSRTGNILPDRSLM